ncbi:MAG: phospholipase D family protein [Thermoguttaceae bacterium]|jgi:hypothetical protein
MNKSVRVVIVDELYSRLHDACTLCASAIWVAPYAKKSVVESLTSALPSEARLTLVTRWHPADIARGVSDTDVLDVVRARPNSELLLHPSLHAKVFLCDDYAFIGSANLTNSGVGLGSRPNVELSTLLQPAPTAVGVFLNRVIYESTIATAKIKAAIDEQAREYERIYGDERQSISLVYQSPDEWHPPWLFPQLRAPDRLFAIYSDADDLPVDVRQDAWRDLAVLNPPANLGREQFQSWIASRLLEIDVVARFDEFVAAPRRFGEMSAWLRANYDTFIPTYDVGQRVAQQMIRWLTFFLPERYTLKTVNYSEILRRST